MCALVALFLLISVAVPAGALGAPNMLTGIEQNGGMGNTAIRNGSLNQMHGLGARTIRYVIRFDRVAVCDPRRTGQSPSNPHNRCYNFSEPIAVVRGARARGMSVIISIRGVPRWQFGSRDEGYLGHSQASYNNFVAVYSDFVQATARQFSGRSGVPRVSMWTIWNEPNGGYFWKPRYVNGKFVSARRYAQMYSSAARRIKAVDRSMLVAVGPTSPTSPQVRPAKYIRVLVNELQRRKPPIDAWAHNGYVRQQRVTTAKIRRNEIGLTNMRKLYKILDSRSVSRGLPVWVTEFAYETGPDSRGVTHAQQAKWLSEATYVAWNDSRIKVFLWYALYDDGTQSQPKTGFQSGLFEAPWRCRTFWCPKPSATAYSFPMHVSNANPQRGTSVVVWGKAHANPFQTAVYVWQGQGWQRLQNALTGDGSVWVSWPANRDAWFVACSSTACGSVVAVRPR